MAVPRRLILDGRRASAAGVAFAGAATIDSFDAHDGHVLTKGHAGVAVWPAALGLLQVAGSREGRALLASVVIGYESGTPRRHRAARHRPRLSYLGRVERAGVRGARRPHPAIGRHGRPATRSVSRSIMDRAAR